MTPPRVHRVIARLNVGGPAMHVVHLSRDLDAEGFRTTLLTGAVTPEEGDMEYFARERGVEPVRVPGLDRRLRLWGLLRAFLFLFRTFQRERPAVVHTHTAMAGAVGRAAAVLARVPVRVHTFHGHVLGGSYFGPLATRLFLSVERLLARFTHALVVLTDAQLEEMAGVLKVASRERFRVIPLGLDLEGLEGAAMEEGEEGPGPPPARAAARRRLGLPDDTSVVGSVGRLVPIKNHELLFRAAAASGSDLHLAVVGGGEREGPLRELAEELGIAPRVHWLGWHRDLSGVYPALDALALTSHDEGTPVAVIEALAAGVPVVARAVGGVPAVLEGGRWGVLVEEAGDEAFRRGLERVLTDPPSPELRRKASRGTVERFHHQRLARDMGELYRELTPG